MPVFDGGEMAARFKADPILSDVPIIFLTATVGPSEMFTSGGFTFLPKPVSLPDLLACIAQRLGPPEIINDPMLQRTDQTPRSDQPIP